MTPQDFVACLRQEVMEQNLRLYNDVLARPLDQITDNYWRKVSQAYSTMSNEQRACCRMIVKQSVIDTISSILGILDATSLLKDYREEFVLRYGDSERKVNGDLQDIFLADLEDNS